MHFATHLLRSAMNRPNGLGDVACPSVVRRARELTRWQNARNGYRTVLKRINQAATVFFL